jgi:hypothetical protein
MMIKFKVWCLTLHQGEEDARVIEAFDAEEAAEKWAEHEDSWSADYWIVGGEEARVMVQRSDGGGAVEFVVTGESRPAYTADAVTPNGPLNRRCD